MRPASIACLVKPGPVISLSGLWRPTASIGPWIATPSNSIRAFFASRPDRRQPPILLVVTHVDLLRPFSEWAPPYDIANPTAEKAKSIRAALEQISGDLGLPLDRIVPVSLDERWPAYNIAVVWALIMATLPEAMRAQLVRRLRGSGSGWSWRKLLSQAVGAGRVAARALSKS